MSVCAIFSHNIKSGNPITTFSVRCGHIIVVAREVKVLPRPISSAASTLGISESQIHVPTMNITAKSGAIEVSLPAGLELDTCGLKYSELLIGELYGRSAA
jgi:hypothetical protein